MLRPGERIFCEWRKGAYLNSRLGAERFLQDFAELVRDYGTPDLVEIREELPDVPLRKAHEMDPFIAKHWMGQTVEQVQGDVDTVGRWGKVVETLFDEKGALHCRVEQGDGKDFWCPAIKLEI